MDITPIIENLSLYLEGLKTTVLLVTSSLTIGLMLAIPLGIAAATKNRWVSVPSKVYIYFIRGTPMLVQMFMLYHGVGQFEPIRNSFLWPVFKQAYGCALISFSLNTAAYTAEILRGAIEQTAFGEVEAAKACGMTRATLYRIVILPSAFRRALPAYGNEVIFMLHGSALAGVITIVDLFGAAKIVNARYFIPFESFITAGIFYLFLTLIITWGFKLAESRWHRHLRPR